MCGKFTAMVSWTELVDFAYTPAEADDGRNDRSVAYRVMVRLPAIVLDRQTGKRRVVPRRWDFRDPAHWRRPRPIHARSETIDITRAFAQAFRDGQRGIVLMNSFNGAPEVKGPTIQHRVTPADEQMPAAALVWRRFEIAGLPAQLLSYVLATVLANRRIATLPTDRMPALVAGEDWETWLGKGSVRMDEVKARLKIVEGVRWTMTREGRAKTAKRSKPVVSDATGLF